jgi:hypothetical protein
VKSGPVLTVDAEFAGVARVGAGVCSTAATSARESDAVRMRPVTTRPAANPAATNVSDSRTRLSI